MARTKKADVPNDLLKLMHPDLPFDDSSVIDKPTKQAQQPDYAAQLAELSANMKRLEEQNTQLQRTNMALMGQPMVPTRPDFGPTEVDLNNLPDPVTNPKEYAAAIVQRGDAVLRARQAAANWEAQQNQDLNERTNQIWEQFSTQHPEYADKADLIEAAAQKAVKQARNSGLDTNKYIFASTPQFFQDTIGILNDWGVKAGETEEKDDDPPPLRTAGIPGGLDSGGQMSKAAEETRIPTLMEEMRDWKIRTGFM